MPFGDWLGIVLLYGVFGFAAMLILGTPLLFCYLRLAWTGFLPFAAGGGLCAGVVAFAVVSRGPNRDLAIFFTVAGVISGLVFRALLFGMRARPAPLPKNF